jgi:UDP-N-acetylenolpyruvoylglucosamine reductase
MVKDLIVTVDQEAVRARVREASGVTLEWEILRVGVP